MSPFLPVLTTVFLLITFSGKVESLEDGTKITYQIHEGMNMMKIKARKLNTAVDIVLDYDYGGANQRHDPRRGRAGGKVP